MNKIIKNLLVSFVSLSLLIGCSSSATSSVKQGYDFSDIKTYSLFPRDSDFTNVQHLSDFQRNRIEIAIENSMEQHNYLYQDMAQADIVVSYYLVGKSRTELNKYNKSVKACLGCTLKEQKRINQKIRSSMLIIDILENERLRTVYRSYIKLKTDVESNSDDNQQVIITAVDELLSNLPSANN